ncbi:MAG: ribosome recycling factor [Candidatus Magasanikbacteria bacterium]|nr:ribosome recycling factor [Candidatus Magasanikbacteria bacterium]
MQEVVKKFSAVAEKAVSHLETEFSGLQVGRASAGLVENMMVEVYGMMQPLKAIAGISIPDARTVQIQPWDRGALAPIEKAIQNSELSINPVNNGVAIILNIPPLTEERRRDLVKVVGKISEDARISIRSARHDAMATLKKMEHDSALTEDELAKGEKQIQAKTDEMNGKIDTLAKKKEESLMTL